MMASFLPVIVSKNNKQTNKNMSFISVYCSVSQIHINPEKKHEKNTKMTSSTYLIMHRPSLQSVRRWQMVQNEI